MGFIHKPSETYFNNRKSAIIVMGHKRYNNALSKKEFEWTNTKKKD